MHAHVCALHDVPAVAALPALFLVRVGLESSGMHARARPV
jgi:hypothetical protein